MHRSTAYYPPTYHIPGYFTNRRMFLPRLYLQLGVFLDCYTEMHQPSVSQVLREILDKGCAESNDFKQAIPELHRIVIPQIITGNQRCDYMEQRTPLSLSKNLIICKVFWTPDRFPSILLSATERSIHLTTKKMQRRCGRSSLTWLRPFYAKLWADHFVIHLIIVVEIWWVLVGLFGSPVLYATWLILW